jgi:hypothetical protein
MSMSEIITSTVTTTPTALEEHQPTPSLGRKRIRGTDSDTNKKQRKSSDDDCFEAARVACQRVERCKFLHDSQNKQEDDNDWNAYTNFSPRELSASTELAKTAIIHLTNRTAELDQIEAQIRARLQATRDQIAAIIRQDFLILGKLVMVEHVRSLKAAATKN